LSSRLDEATTASKLKFVAISVRQASSNKGKACRPPRLIHAMCRIPIGRHASRYCNNEKPVHDWLTRRREARRERGCSRTPTQTSNGLSTPKKDKLILSSFRVKPMKMRCWVELSMKVVQKCLERQREIAKGTRRRRLIKPCQSN